MKTQALIHKLAMEAEPVRPLGRPIERSAWWMAAATLCISIGVGFAGIRSDVGRVLLEPIFILREILMLVLAFVSVFAAFTLAVPDRSRRWFELMPVAAVIACFVLLGYRLLGAGGFSGGSGIRCVWSILVFSVPAGALLYSMLRNAAPLRTGMTGWLAALGTAAFANFATQLICKQDGPMHVLVWHVIPIVVVCGIGIILGRIIFTWDRGSQALR